MILLVKIFSIVVVLILFLRFKLNLSLAIFLISAYTVLLFQLSVKAALNASWAALSAPATLQLFVIIVMVLYIAALMKSQKMLDKLIASLNSFIRDKRIVAMIAPAVVGFLPMPGGALVSAPLVDVSTQGMKLKPEFSTFLNYWFRHVWEFVWPIYAGLLIFQTMSGIPLKKIILFQSPFTVLNIVTGLAVSFLYFKKHQVKREIPARNSSITGTVNDFFQGIWPLLLVVLLYFVFSLPLYLSLTLAAAALTVILLAARALTIRDVSRSLFSKTVLTTLVLIAAVMIFQRIIQAADIFASLDTSGFSTGMVVLACFLVSFAMGFLTGVNMAFIVISYPILLPLIRDIAGINFFYTSLYIYVIGFAGILASPVHLCLVLTNEYFKSSLYRVYRYLAPPVIILALLSTILVLIL